MRKSHIKIVDKAVVGVVTAVLLIGLVVAVIALVQTAYVPKMMEQREAEHMDVVADQFARLKSAIDSQAFTQRKGIPVATSMTLGNKELPFLMSVRAFGTLEILLDEFTVGVTYSQNGTESLSKSFGTLKYSSANVYFLDQSYIYETGAVIVSQYLGNMMLVKPSFYAIHAGSNVNMSFDLVNISGVGEKLSVTGYGTYPIQTEYVDSESNNITDVDNIYIGTSFPNAWRLFLESTFVKAGLSKDVDFSVSQVDGGILLDLTINDNLNYSISLSITDIDAQIGPGWVE